MELKLFNTLSREKEVFTPITAGKVGMYSCGPTVYNYAHIGNLRTYIFTDILRRVLLFNKFDVNHVMNITDVGHLTSDADSGEDKMEKGATREGKSVWDIAQFYTDAFKQDMALLNIQEPTKWVKATDHIKEQIEQIKILEEKGHTYKTSDGIYFDTATIMDYGAIAKLHIQNLEAGARVEMGEKKNKTDFALWKFSPQDEQRQMEWDSPWGKGFPGWHIECSAMSMKYLGNHFDIHTGGTDHIPIHHTNEIAQAESALADNKPWVNYWLHGEFLVIGDTKMAKSGENFLTLAKLQEMGYSSMVYRYFCLTAHYRQQLSFNESALESAKNSYERLKNIVAGLQNEANGNGTVDTKALEAFHAAINDDLNMPKALAVLWEVVRSKEHSAQDTLATLEKMDTVFGLKLLEQEVLDIPQDVQELADKREEARKNKDWKTSDELRDALAQKGWEVSDGKEGYVLKKK